MSIALRLLTISLWLGLALVSHAATSIPAWQIVFASYGTEAGAQAAIKAYRVDLPLTVVPVTINGRDWYRVASVVSTSDDSVAALLAAKKIFPDAWLLRSSVDVVSQNEPTTVAAAVPEPTSGAAASVSPPVESSLVAVLPTDATVAIAELSTDATPLNPDEGELRMKLNPTSDSVSLQRFDNAKIKVDGKLDEAVWSQVAAFDQFLVIDPDTLEVPRFKTEAIVFYSKDGLYIGTRNAQPPETLLARLTSRDKYINRDGVSLTLDTSGQGLYGLWFGINLGGTLVDGTVLPERNYSTNWDGPWRGNSAETEDGYTTEMFLPWSMMSMPETNRDRVMGIYFSRKVAYIDERWGFPALPATGSRLMSALQPIEMADVQPSQQIALFPFAAATYDKLNPLGDKDNYKVGTDLFWRPSTDLQITATVNPDFGAIESDDVVVNLTAFEVFFPEQRLFFLEGSEIFVTTPRSNPSQGIGSSSNAARQVRTRFNPTPTTLVNTRRIGGAPIEPDIPVGVDVPDIELVKPTELLGAVKVTGDQGPFRYGVLAAFEDDSQLVGTDALDATHVLDQTGRDFGILRLLYETTNKGRTGVGWITTAVMHESKDAFVHGVDLHYQTADSKLKLDAQLMYSDVADEEGAGLFFESTYVPRRGVSHKITLDYLGDTLDVNDFGFIRRNDAYSATYSINHISSSLSWSKLFINSLLFSQEYNIEGKVVRSGIFWRTTSNFDNNSSIKTRLSYFPERWDDRNSEGNGDYRIHDRWSGQLSYGTDSGKILSFSIGAGVEEEELGGTTYDGQLGLTFKPSDRFSLELDAFYRDHDGWLIHRSGRDFTTYDAENWQPGAAMDVFFNARHQLRFTMQWVGIKADEEERWLVPINGPDLLPVARAPTDTARDFSISRITAQLRYRWEIAPLSDLFVVYTRGSNLPSRPNDEFSDLFTDSLENPIVDVFVVKLRYRFGN